MLISLCAQSPAVWAISISNTLSQIEPIGSAKPKFSSILKSSSIEMTAESPLALTCPAQGSPLPAFRYFNYNLVFLHFVCRTHWQCQAKVLQHTEPLRFPKGGVSKRSSNLSSSRIAYSGVQVNKTSCFSSAQSRSVL